MVREVMLICNNKLTDGTLCAAEYSAEEASYPITLCPKCRHARLARLATLDIRVVTEIAHEFLSQGAKLSELIGLMSLEGEEFLVTVQRRDDPEILNLSQVLDFFHRSLERPFVEGRLPVIVFCGRDGVLLSTPIRIPKKE